MLMAMCMKESGSMTMLMEKANIRILTELIILETGLTINKVDWVWRVGLMVPSTKVIIWKG